MCTSVLMFEVPQNKKILFLLSYEKKAQWIYHEESIQRPIAPLADTDKKHVLVSNTAIIEGRWAGARVTCHSPPSFKLFSNRPWTPTPIPKVIPTRLYHQKLFISLANVNFTWDQVICHIFIG